MIRRFRHGLVLGLAAAVLALPAPVDAADEARLEFHFTPAENLQIAIWLETTDGEHLTDVFVTQATGKLGIGNRSGLWNFLSSWRAPYGPRKPVLPIWGHRRGVTYPEVIFHDGNPNTADSLGFHEGTSSFEGYYCRPLRPSENEAVMDVMTCPSPQTFQSDKGRFSGETTIYPPRNDLLESNFEEGDDHVNIMMYPEINDLDTITGATPNGDNPTFEVIKVHRDLVGDQPIVAWIEVSLEHDENDDWDFDREDDHHVDSKLPDYGVEWLGQPSVVYRVELNPDSEGFTGTDEYFGYGSWDGSDGEINSPDSTISMANGSGADRLQEMDKFGELFRFGVWSDGFSDGGGGEGTGEEGGDGDGDGGGSCSDIEHGRVENLEVEPLDFDRVALRFDFPSDLDADTEVSKIRVFAQPSQNALDVEEIKRGEEHEFAVCGPGEMGCPVQGDPDQRAEVVIDQLFGDFTYQFALSYVDRCANESEPKLGTVTTPSQSFQQIDTFCVIATAAYGANWADEVGALRAFRDVVLRKSAIGREGIRYYYAYGPSLARTIGTSALLRANTRAILQPLANLSAPLMRLGGKPDTSAKPGVWSGGGTKN